MDEYQRPIVTVDIAPIVIHGGRLKILLAERENEPHAGALALIGGYVHVPEDQSAGASARRVLREKAGITQLYVEQLSTFSGPERDPRGWSLSVAYISLSPYERIASAMTQGHLHLVDVQDANGLPFDHDLIVRAAIERIRGKGAYSDLFARLLPDEFTIPDLHDAYEIAVGPVNKDAFRKRILERGFIEETGERRNEAPGRPSQVYRLKRGPSAVFDRRL